MTSVVTTGKVGVARASGNRVTSLIAPPGSRCCGRVVNTCVALQTGGATARLRRYAVRREGRTSVRCESCHRLSSLFGQPNLRCPARARTPGAVQSRSRPVEHASTGRKAFGDTVLRVVERGAFCGCAARRLGVVGAVRRRDQRTTWTAGSAGEEFPTDRGRSCRVVRGSIGDEAERSFFFLRVVQPENGVQPVEQSAEFDDVLGFGAVRVEPVEQSS